jgi:prepilin-type N-terminal cleavage/methylation domain-containing protein
MKKNGFSLAEILVVTAIMGIMALAMMTMQSNQVKANNFLQFQLKRTELQGAILGQILNDPNQCACLFQGASTFLASTAAVLPGATLSGVAPTQIGRFPSPPPLCGVPIQSLINNVGIDGVKSASILLTNITGAGTNFSGNLTVDLQSTKDVLGPSHILMSIPVNVAATTSGANVTFTSCSTSGYSTGPNCVHLLSAPNNWSASVSCPVDYPNAIAGNCSTSCRTIRTNTLSTTTQFCDLLPTGNFCVQPGQYIATASITCCK